MKPKKHCLLIVDDEPNVCDSVHDLLRREFRVLKAHSAQEGYRLMQEEEVHIVMSDQRMPQITGVELLAKVKSRYPQAVRMLFTGFADLESIIAAINQGHIYRLPEEAVAARGTRGRRPPGRRGVRPADRGRRAARGALRTWSRASRHASRRWRARCNGSAAGTLPRSFLRLDRVSSRLSPRNRVISGGPETFQGRSGRRIRRTVNI